MPRRLTEYAGLRLGLGLGFSSTLVFGSALWPDLRPAWMQEDGPLETLAVILFAGACAMGVYKWLDGKRVDWLLIAVAAFCAIAALDELSFGERLFGFQAPIVNGVKIDGLHDLLDLARQTISQWTDAPYVWASAGAALLAVVLVSIRRHLPAIDLKHQPPADLGVLFTAAAMITLAMLLDVHFRPIDLELLHGLGVEEIFETTAALLLVLFVAARPVWRQPEAALAPVSTAYQRILAQGC